MRMSQKLSHAEELRFEGLKGVETTKTTKTTSFNIKRILSFSFLLRLRITST